MKSAETYSSNLTKITKIITCKKLQKVGLLTISNFEIQSNYSLLIKIFLRNHNITVKLNDGSVTNKAKLANLFYSSYTNIVENISGVPPAPKVILSTKMKLILL